MIVEDILAGESKTLEYKEQRPKDYSKYIKTVVAFANGRGGRLVFGIADRTMQVVGIADDVLYSEMDALASVIDDACEPKIIPDIYPLTIDGKNVIVVEVGAGRQKPYFVKAEGLMDGVYVRVGATSRRADRDMTRELYYDSEGRSFDTVVCRDLTVSEEEVDWLCNAMKNVALAECKDETQRKAVKDVTKNVLLSWGILVEENGVLHPTNAYVYLMGQEAFLSKIQCGLFRGTSRGDFLDRKDCVGPLWEQVQEAHQFVLRNIRYGSRLQGVFRVDSYELPPDSIRELIVNAVMNCSFLQNSHIQIAIFDDRLEITTPGGLMPNVTVERMIEGYSQIRNKALAHAFAYMKLIEGWGVGIPKLMREMKEYGLREPEFLDRDGFLRINLYRDTPDLRIRYTVPKQTMRVKEADAARYGYGNVTQSAYEDMSDIENKTKIVDALRQNPRMTQVELAALLGVSRRVVQRLMLALLDEGRIARAGSKRSGSWIVM